MSHQLTANFRSPCALARFVLTMSMGLGLDLWTKTFAFAHLATSSGARPTSRSHEFIPGWLHFYVTTNTGAVFGLGEGQRTLFVAVSVAAILFLTYLFATSGHQRFYQFVLGLLLAGVLGNMYDRVQYGFVRDMIHALPGWQWPGSWTVPFIGYPDHERRVFPWIFNVADVLLCTGVGLMIIYSFVAARPVADVSSQTPRPQKPQQSPTPRPN